MEHRGGGRQGGWDTEVCVGGRVGMVVQLSGTAGRRATRSNAHTVTLSNNQLRGGSGHRTPACVTFTLQLDKFMQGGTYVRRTRRWRRGRTPVW